jgi:hypothetical protein
VSNDIDESNIIKRACAGRCGVVLRYRRGPYREGYTPEETCLDGYTAYRGGHLCRCCDVAVSEALGARRLWRQPKRAARNVSARVSSRGRR